MGGCPTTRRVLRVPVGIRQEKLLEPLAGCRVVEGAGFRQESTNDALPANLAKVSAAQVPQLKPALALVALVPGEIILDALGREDLLVPVDERICRPGQPPRPPIRCIERV